MILTDDNTAAFKRYHGIPDDFSCYRQNFRFGKCAAFRRYWTDKRGKWNHAESIEDYIFIYGNQRFNGWETLRLHLAEVWRPQAQDDRAWYIHNIAS